MKLARAALARVGLPPAAWIFREVELSVPACVMVSYNVASSRDPTSADAGRQDGWRACSVNRRREAIDEQRIFKTFANFAGVTVKSLPAALLQPRRRSGKPELF